MYRKQKGFTLIELLVVIAIIGLLSTLAVVALTSARAKARDAKRISDVKQTQTALELHFAEKQKYPDVAAESALGQAGFAKLCDQGFVASGTACTNATFMGKVPRDASKKDTDAAALCTATVTEKCDYAYTDTGTTQTTYQIRFSLEGASGELGQGLNCGTQDGLKKGNC